MMPKFGLATTAIAMIRVDGGRLQRKEGKGFFGVAFHSFSLALKFTCPLQVWCVLEYSSTVRRLWVTMLGCSVGVLPGIIFFSLSGGWLCQEGPKTKD